MNRQDILRLWGEADFATPLWSEWAMDEVVTDDSQILAITDNASHPISTLLLQPYHINWLDNEAPSRMGYISCAATAKAHRNEGLMKSLIMQAMRRAYDEGMALVTVIPANRPLFFFYDKIGFSTVVYEDRRRYVAGAVFTLHESEAPVCAPLTAGETLSDDDIERLIDIERSQRGAVVHTPQQLANCIADNRMDHGTAMVARDRRGTLQGLALAVPSAETVSVSGIISSSVHSERAMLHAIAGMYSHLPMVAHCAVTLGRPMMAKGMGRIVDVASTMAVIARSRAVDHSRPRYIRVHDSIIAENNHTWCLHDGEATIADEAREKYDLDVPVEVLTRILCSGESVSDIFELPTCRPSLFLMLE